MRPIFFVLVLIGLPSICWTAEVEVPVAVQQTISSGGADYCILLRFDLPKEVLSGRIIRGVVRYPTAMRAETDLSVRVQRAPSGWESAANIGTWWTENMEAVESVSNIGICSAGYVESDITRLVRDWAARSEANTGLLISAAGERDDLPEPIVGGGAGPVLRVVYRP